MRCWTIERERERERAEREESVGRREAINLDYYENLWSGIESSKRISRLLSLVLSLFVTREHKESSNAPAALTAFSI